MRRVLLLHIFFAVVSLTMAQTARNFELSLSADSQAMVYAYLPQRPTGRAIVCCPGGGYSHLSMDNEGHDWATFFTNQGIAYFVLKYRMPHGDRRLPLSDAYRAMQTVRDSAVAWHINPADVGIMGFSAGGHLASAVSTHAPWRVHPNFTILFYPVISMGQLGAHKGSVVNFMGTDKDDKQLIAEWSSDQVVRPHLTPRTLLLMANDDRAVPVLTNGLKYYEAMRRAGNECSLLIYPSGGHGFGFRDSFPFHHQMLSDLKTWLGSFSAPVQGAVRVACIGNSITDGMGIDMAEQNAYPAQLQHRLGDAYWVMNFGVSGRTLLNKGDHPYMREQAWHDALAFCPHIAIVKLGTNDAKPNNWRYKAEWMADYGTLIDSLHALPTHPRIYICTPIPGEQVRWGIRDSIISNEVCPLVTKVAKKKKVHLIDLHSLFKNTDGKLMQKDGVHPTLVGAYRLAEIIAEQIKE